MKRLSRSVGKSDWMPQEILPDALKQLGDAPIRIDWYGDVVQARRWHTTVPSVRLSCSRYAGPDVETAPAMPLPGGVELPVALLRLVRLGDIWKQG